MATMEMEDIDNQIRDLRTRISHLQAHRANLTTALLSAPHLPTRLQQRPVSKPIHAKKALKAVQKQQARNVKNIYRACAGVTAYKVKDPDPNAVDGGNILGVRIEVEIDGHFVETYHVLLHRPNPKNKIGLKVHKHTIPTCIPLLQLAKTHLPQMTRDSSTMPEQNITKFAQKLRKELVSWHLRRTAIGQLRVEAGLPAPVSNKEEETKTAPAMGKVLNAFISDDEDESDEDEPRRRGRAGPNKIVDIEADESVREITVTWSNGRAGRMVVTKDGEVERGVVRTVDGTRVTEMERKAVGRIEGLVARLMGN
ncbi:hypothetical protein K469DRAFT_717403 [Zopfia rhizophila CBS 207.26]|uniref:Cenp-O kinetochore centromere component n=1 Tax=Zopfia rhizophila CBS 207.26 TaxID=1314779 RepID=A0A6A6ENP7_9PEZI|nr:hypothetical protein K469DRAFT_717403 [Zopfia rhizophila CBS 207.26]